MCQQTKLISWNVNGIRSILKKGFLQFLKKEAPDVVCLQEVRARREEVDLDLPEYHIVWNPSRLKAGYSGTAILSKIKPIATFSGMGIEKHDQEGRVITAEFETFFLVNVYTPNSKRDLSRLSYREKEWDVSFFEYLKRLEGAKPVVFCGDLNVAHKEIDLAHPEANRKNHGFTDEERRGFDRIIKSGFIDTFRQFHSDGGHYTWWRQFGGCRARNVGWRIDYFCVSHSLGPWLEDAYILPGVMGSDHCPIGMVLRTEEKERGS